MASSQPTRTIRIEALTRVEGEGGLHVRLRDGMVEDVQLQIYEPPRFFEAFLRGRSADEVPDITARICGICPVAYQMSSAHALEQALGVNITPEIRRLRRLLYCGEWIESHALHIYLLNAPDFLKFESGLEMAERFPDEVNRGLRMRKIGNQLLEVLGGRAIHPINVAVGGYYRSPSSEALRLMIPEFEWAIDAAVETTRWVAGFEFPDFSGSYELVSLVHPDEYPMNEGTINGSSGWSVPVSDFETEFTETQVPHSTALHCVRAAGGTSYLVGPLARGALNLDRLSPTARRVADELKLEWPCHNPYRSIVARGLELIHACEEALSILREYEPLRPARIPYEYRAGEGMSATEAPRGLLYHRYRIDDAGKVCEAKIVPPTSQNQRQIEADLRQLLPNILMEADATVARNCENLIRCYDPCISCSTHFLRVVIERG